jgi:hypothetical protein
MDPGNDRARPDHLARRLGRFVEELAAEVRRGLAGRGQEQERPQCADG